jgi:hypothetical protein
MSIIISLNLDRTRNQQTNFAYNPTQYIYVHHFGTPQGPPQIHPSQIWLLYYAISFKEN